MGARKTVPPLGCCQHNVRSALRICLCVRLQLVSDGAVGRQPHLLELELVDTLLVWGDGRALDTNRVLLDSLGGIERDLVVGLVTVWQTEVVVLEVDVEVGEDELAWSVSLVPAYSVFLLLLLLSCLFLSYLWHWSGRTLSLMDCQMILVISSPSSSTTGFLTLILLAGAEDAIL